MARYGMVKGRKPAGYRVVKGHALECVCNHITKMVKDRHVIMQPSSLLALCMGRVHYSTSKEEGSSLLTLATSCPLHAFLQMVSMNVSPKLLSVDKLPLAMLF